MAIRQSFGPGIQPWSPGHASAAKYLPQSWGREQAAPGVALPAPPMGQLLGNQFGFGVQGGLPGMSGMSLGGAMGAAMPQIQPTANLTQTPQAPQTQQQQQTGTIPWASASPGTTAGQIAGAGMNMGSQLMGQQLGSYLNFGNAMQGAMSQMWDVNRHNQAASLAIRAIEAKREAAALARQMQQDRLSALQKMLGTGAGGGGGGMPTLQTPQLPMPEARPGAVWRRANAQLIPAWVPDLSALRGLPTADQNALTQMGGEQANEAAQQARTMFNLAGAPAEAQHQASARQQQEQARQAAQRLAMQIYGRELQDELTRRALFAGAV